MGLLNSGMLGMLPMLMQQQQQPGMGAMSDREAGMMGQQAPPPPQGGPMGGGLAGAFSNNPQFQQQLQAMMSQQSPGFQGAQMQQPQMPVGTTPQQPGGARNMRGALFGNPLNNYGTQGDPSQYFMNLLGRSQG